MFRVRALLAITVFCGSTAFAQTDLCQLTVHVRATDNRDIGSHLQVELVSPSGTPIETAQTNDDGRAFFQVMSGVTYHVRVSGSNIEPSVSEFFIFGGQVVQTENIDVKRRLMSQPQQAAQGTSPTVSLAEMNVPAKAREEMQKGTEAFDKGDMAKARQRFEKAVSIYPRYARAYGNLGIIATKEGDRQKAREMFAKAIAVDDNYLPGYMDMARMEIQDKHYPQAESLLGKVALLDPSSPEALALLAGAEYGNKEYDKALADAQRVHSLPGHEPFASAHLLAAQILEMQNRNRDAIAEYQMFLKEAPGSPQAKQVQGAVADLEASGH